MKVIVVEDFFKNPEYITEYANSFIYKSRSKKEYFEGVRTETLKNINPILFQDVSTKIIREFFGNNNYNYDADLYFHKTTDYDKKDHHWLKGKVHTDDAAIVSGIIYLNKKAPINCGTQTYREIKNKDVPDIIVGNKYNRLIAFSSNYLHSAMDFFGKEKDCRLVMLFFLTKLNPL
jgi:hypothetical protein